ncbi:uncharacterized protein G2W53_027967 [Senna tora]|uniref:Uncharacterized protein n=1 Tax=Senna tora TaxID=362788 RepID=A0A834T052_9FABA|nr:uncharacterized protein G2W53_027967 [Senna tora]
MLMCAWKLCFACEFLGLALDLCHLISLWRIRISILLQELEFRNISFSGWEIGIYGVPLNLHSESGIS